VEARPLEERVHDPDRRTRHVAYQEITRGDHRFTSELLADARNPTDGSVERCNAIDALGDAGDPAALDALFDLVLHDEDPEVAFSAARSIRLINDPSAIPRLIELLSSRTASAGKALFDAESEVDMAFMDLGAASLEPLASLLDSTDPKLRMRALTLLSALGEKLHHAPPSVIEKIRAFPDDGTSMNLTALKHEVLQLYDAQ
jgi:hypothetical protein